MLLFGDLKSRSVEAQAVRKWRKSVIGQRLEAHTQEYFVKTPRLSALSQAKKEQLIGDFYAQVSAVAKADNPFLAMREKVAAYGCSYAEVTVLCLTEKEKAVMSYSGNPYISGTLHQHILKAADHVDRLRELKWENPDLTPEDLVSFCNSQGALFSYYLNGYHYVRMEFDDYYQTKDWFQPFVVAMMVWYEDNIRQKIDLLSLLPDPLDALRYSTFLNLVADGAKNPYYEWDKQWGSANAPAL